MAKNINVKYILGLDVNEFRTGMQRVSGTLNNMQNQFNNLGSTIGGVFAIYQIKDFTQEAIEMGSALQKASAGFARFGDEADLEGLRQSTRGLLTDLQLMNQAVKGANLGIPLKEMGTLLEFAKRRADETGESIDYLVNSLVEGIGKKSTLRLDNLGIAGDRVREALHGVSLQAATVEQVSTAMATIATEELGKMGKPIETAADEMARLRVEFDNFKAELGVGLGDIFVKSWKNYSNLFKMLDAFAKGEFKQALGFGAMLVPGEKASETGENTQEENIKATIVSIASLKKELEALNTEFEQTEIGTKRFNELRVAAEELQQRITDLTQGVVPQTEALKLNAKTTNDVYNAQEKSLRIMRQLPDAGLAYAESIQIIKRNMAELEAQTQAISVIGLELGYIFSSAFQAAIVDGEDFFTKMRQGIKAYIQQMIAATAATLTLAAALAIIFPKIGFNAAFNAIGGGMGLPFGFNDNNQLSLRLSGTDFYGGVVRNTNRVARSGG